MILGRGYGFLGSAGGGIMRYPQRKKKGLLEINEQFIHSKEYGFIVLVSNQESALPRGSQSSRPKNNLIK